MAFLGHSRARAGEVITEGRARRECGGRNKSDDHERTGANCDKGCLFLLRFNHITLHPPPSVDLFLVRVVPSTRPPPSQDRVKRAPPPHVHPETQYFIYYLPYHVVRSGVLRRVQRTSSESRRNSPRSSHFLSLVRVYVQSRETPLPH